MTENAASGWMVGTEMTEQGEIEPSSCPVTMWPDGPECSKQVGHDRDHHGISDNIRWTYTACWEPSTIYGVEYHCIREQGHEGGHAGG